LRLSHYIFLGAGLLAIMSCSQEKNTIVNRGYHNMTSRYNGFFNGRLALQESHQTMKDNYQEDYTSLLPLYIEEKDEVVQPVYPKLDRAIEKTSLVVDRHSMDISGKEYCKWIDDTWLVMGEAQFLKKEYIQAKQIFDFTKRKYPDEETKQISYLWLGRLHAVQGEYQRANDQYRKVSIEDGFPEKRISELYAAKTDLYIKQDRYDDAITWLEKCIEHTRKRQVKTRRMFLLAQLYRLEGDGRKSSDLYAEVIKRNPEYEMAFYAKINRALAYDVTAGNTEEIKEILFKMLKDEKNIEYKDQIYYALAELELKEDNEPKGIEYLKLATQKSVRNGNTKGLAYYKLGEIYFAKPNYPVAQAYYDSTISFLSQEHPDYDQILALASSLTQMMRDVEIVEREDSLQAFALLSEKEQKRIIDQRIQDVIQEERDKKRQKEIDQMQSQAAKFQQNTAFNKSMNKGQWYFYNPGAVGFGASEFNRIWGKRKNEDNWRRADKTSEIPLNLGDGDDMILAEDTIEGADDPKNEIYYRKSIPDTEEKLERSHALIVEALYDLAIVYKDQMKDDPKAIETFEELIARYDTSKYHISSHYQLYLMYAQNGNQAKSDFYKNLILDKYPNSEYAKVIRDPNYAQNAVKSESELAQQYEEAYAAFDQGLYRKAFTLSEAGLEGGQHEFTGQFMLLQALCLGSIDSEARMVSELETVAKQYGSSPVGEEARKILAYIKNGKVIDSKVEEAESALSEAETESALASYTYNIGDMHNFILIVDDSLDANRIQITVSDFNRSYFSTKGFKTSMIPLKNERNMIVVSSVGYATKAMDYYNTFSTASESTKALIDSGGTAFVISLNNYAVFFKNQSTEVYNLFFSENYLKTK